MAATLIRSAKTIRRLRDTARDALRAVRALEELDSDIFGQYVIDPGEEFDASDLCDFIQLARETYRGQEVVVVVLARK